MNLIYSMISLMAVSLVVFGDFDGALAQWVQQQMLATTNLYSTAKTSPKLSCANFGSEKTIICVFLNWSNSAERINLYERISYDGGVTWSSATMITSDPGDEYDPYIEYDSGRNRMALVYGKWHDNVGGNGNDTVIRFRDSTRGSWSNPVTVAGDGKNDYWVASLLTLQSGTMLVPLTENGPESHAGLGSGRIKVARSLDGGRTWSPPIFITNTCDAEYPRAVQNSYGSILLVFSRYVDISHFTGGTPCADGLINGYPKSDIHQIWSNDEGLTWTGESVLFSDPNSSSLHPYVAAETSRRQTPCPGCLWDILFVKSGGGGSGAYTLQSSTQGLSWNGPILISQSSWQQPYNIDPIFTIGCRGYMAAYADGYPGQNVYVRRYDWSSNCSID